MPAPDRTKERTALRLRDVGPEQKKKKKEVLWSKAVTTSMHSRLEGSLEGMGREKGGKELEKKKNRGSLIVTAFIKSTTWVPLFLVATPLTDQGRRRSPSFPQTHRGYSCKIPIISLKPNQAVGTEI